MATDTVWHLRCTSCGWYRQLPAAYLVEDGKVLHDRRCWHSRYDVTELPRRAIVVTSQSATATPTERLF